MAGFNQNRKKNVEIDEEDYEFDDTGLDIDKGEVDDIHPPARKQLVREKDDSGKKNKIILIACISVVLTGALAVGTIMIINHRKALKYEEQRLSEEQEIARQNALANQKTDTQAGIPNLNISNETQNKSEPVKDSVITTNLQQVPIDANYKVKEYKTVTDFVNYKKYRAVTGKGVEFYWLEATYKKQPYKIQVPFQVFNNLEEEGITVVNVEVSVLEDNSEVITYMSVKKDAKTLLDNGR
ncbi:hypothetical protein D3C81_1367710 [compost metagenome]